MADVAADVTRLPPMFVARGVAHEGGIYNAPMDEGFTFSSVEEAMESATVVLLNAGFLIPKLAVVSLAMLEATLLPIWLNVYLSRPGLTRSTQLHTDKQDVLLVQCSGRKRWRVYAPPEPSKAAGLDPFGRGKGTDLNWEPGELLLDVTTAPGEVLYIPAGFPHETDTLAEASRDDGVPASAAGGVLLRDGTGEDEFSVHLTIGVDTHLWGLNYATLREQALLAVGQPATITLPSGAQAPITALPLEQWSALSEPLPLGFLAAPHLQAVAPVDASAASADLAIAKGSLVSHIAAEAARRMVAAETERCRSMVGAPEDASVDTVCESLVSTLKLRDVASRFVDHHAAVLAIQETVYRRTAHEPSAGGLPSMRERKAAIDQLFGAMDQLDLVMDNLAKGVAPPSAAALHTAAVGRAGPAGPTAAAAAPGLASGSSAKAGGFGGGGAPAKAGKKGGKAKSKKR